MVKESDLAGLMTPVNAAGTPAEGRTSTDADLRDLAELASRMVASWPRFSEQRKAELARLLASG